MSPLTLVSDCHRECFPAERGGIYIGPGNIPQGLEGAQRDVPTVVPAECIEQFSPLFLRRRWTCATSFETDAVGVPSGIRQKSAVHDGGVGRSVKSSEDAMPRCLVRTEKCEKDAIS
jgi:hypothetical protein